MEREKREKHGEWKTVTMVMEGLKRNSRCGALTSDPREGTHGSSEYHAGSATELHHMVSRGHMSLKIRYIFRVVLGSQQN
jgi:hypothetical protein